jgi:hypothetical protein
MAPAKEDPMRWRKAATGRARLARAVLALAGLALLSLGCGEGAPEPAPVESKDQALCGCKKLVVLAHIHATLTASGCTSPVGLCTAGTVSGLGIYGGTTYFTAQGAAMAAGMSGVEPDSTLSYAGDLQITTRFGNLTISDVGIWDQMSLVYTEVQRVVMGTGIYAGATGTLFSSGSTPGGTAVDGLIRGTLCLPSSAP